LNSKLTQNVKSQY